MGLIAIIIGSIAVVSVLADMINTLVTTQTSKGRWWLSRRLTALIWFGFRSVAVRMPDDENRDRFLAAFAPTLVFALLVTWVGQQVLGFGLLWWGLGGVDGVAGFTDSLYYSGVVFFTVGFGEVVPAATVPRFGALVEAFAGVLTTALVIGYLPALYGAFSERERKLMTLDDGTEDRITPTNLVLAWAPDADVDVLMSRFGPWEDWVAGVIETHTTFPMLRFFRSHHRGQNWITALGLVSDAALHCQIIKGAENRAPYFMLRRAIRLLQELTVDADLTAYRDFFDNNYYATGDHMFRDLYDQLERHGFDLFPFDEAHAASRALRSQFDDRLEYLIDELVAPRGFWGHTIGHVRDGSLPSSLRDHGSGPARRSDP